MCDTNEGHLFVKRVQRRVFGSKRRPLSVAVCQVLLGWPDEKRKKETLQQKPVG